jgi:hypothetical protein
MYFYEVACPFFFLFLLPDGYFLFLDDMISQLTSKEYENKDNKHINDY